MDIEKEITSLREQLNRHNYNYYVLDAPEITDYEFDMKLNTLQKLEAEYPQYRDPNSPTVRVGGMITKKFKTIKHSIRMYSLDNSYSKEDLVDWERRIGRVLGEEAVEFTCELKYDGASISL